MPSRLAFYKCREVLYLFEKAQVNLESVELVTSSLKHPLPDQVCRKV
jgi:hypothetical protein